MLYTAVYRPAEGRAEYRWPGFAWPQSFAAFSEGAHDETLAEGSVARTGDALDAAVPR